MVGQFLSGKYKVEEKLGVGGMGTVYKAADARLHRPVALKVLHPQFSSDPLFLKRFHREACAMAQMDHKNIIRVFDVAEQDDVHYIVMEYFPGTNVKHRLAKGKLHPHEAIQISIEALSGLAYAHTHGIIHRDVKPENIMIHDDGRVKIADFGIAAATDEASLTMPGQVLGTPVYMAPEQAQNQPVDKRVDLYALGVVLYEMVTGRTPLHGLSTTAVLAKLVSEKDEFQLVFPAEIPLSMRTLITSLVKRNAQARPRDMNGLMKQMQGIERELAPPAPTETLVSCDPPSSPPWQRKEGEKEEEEQDRTVAVFPVEGQRPRTRTGTRAPSPPKKAFHLRWLAAGVGTLAVVGGGVYYFTSSPMTVPPAPMLTDQTVASKPVERPPSLPASPSFSQPSEEQRKTEPLQPLTDERTPPNAPPVTIAPIAKQETPVVPPPKPQPAPVKAPEKPKLPPTPSIAVKPNKEKEAPPAPKLPEPEIKEQKPRENVSRADITEQVAALRKSEQQLNQSRQKAKAADADQWASQIYQEATALEEEGDEVSRKSHDFINSQQFEEAQKSLARAQTLLDQSAQQFNRSASKAAEQKAEDERDVKEILAKLQRAYEGRDLQTLMRMGPPSAGQVQFLEQLFSNYSAIHIVVSSPAMNPQSARAVITITKLFDRQGNIVTPGERWKETRITIYKSDNQWKKIAW